MMRTPLTEFVDLVYGVGWQWVSCSRCQASSHGPVGAALPAKDRQYFLSWHEHPRTTASQAREGA